MNGAQVVAKAWTDPEFKAALLADGTKAIEPFEEIPFHKLDMLDQNPEMVKRI